MSTSNGLIMLGVSVLAVIIIGFIAVSHTSNSNLGSNSTTTIISGYGTLFAQGGRTNNVTYCTQNGVNLDLDMFFPNATNETFPAVIYVHGGGWTGGSDSGFEGAQRSDVSLLASNGMIVASVDYRVAPAYMFPAMIEDVKCAVRYLRAHASEYKINPNEIGAYGDSAGGHIVSLLGLAGPSVGWDGGQWSNESSSVQAVVDMFGPTNLTLFISNGHQNKTVYTAFGTNTLNLTKDGPVTYVHAGAPPFLIQQGINDTTVPEDQSILFYNDLVADGDNATLVLIQNAGHEFGHVGTGPITPSIQTLQLQRIKFLKSALGLG